MYKLIKALLTLSAVPLFVTANKAYASYYEGSTYQTEQVVNGIIAGTKQSCKIPEGEITKVVASLQRYNMIVAKSSSTCIALVALVSD